MTIQRKRCLITGATSGLGKVTAIDLARMGAELIIVSRDENKCRQTVKAIQAQTGNQRVDYFSTDLSSQAEIRDLANKLKSKYDCLDVLINNAGGIFWTRQESVDGIEMTFALNHLNYFLTSNLLLDLLEKSPMARIVNVASGSHAWGELDFDNLQYERNYFLLSAYSRSKLANVYFTYELDRRLNGKPIYVNAVNPGFTISNIGRGNLLGKIIMPITRIYAKPTVKGAESIIYVASSEEVKGISGKYFQDKKEIFSSPSSYDREIGQRLWRISEKLTGLTQEN